ncbi:hypothetical protein CPB85DRAFT_1341616 [Mucidula mucida]|nr:hypothetical protein CPB85DRAFT_1341616 [Mucidula mucida]
MNIETAVPAKAGASIPVKICLPVMHVLVWTLPRLESLMSFAHLWPPPVSQRTFGASLHHKRRWR